jgi:uncharacterized protein YchJ
VVLVCIRLEGHAMNCCCTMIQRRGGHQGECFVQRDVKATAQSTSFLKLQVLSTEEEQGSDEVSVEFRVWFKDFQKNDSSKQAVHTMTERSRFKKEDDRWLCLEAV